MGRKIPGKKHKTVKNPHIQNLKRLESLKGKINNPPVNSNEQEIPKSLIRIMELKEKSKAEIFKRPKKRIREKNKNLLSVEKFLNKDSFQEGITKSNDFIPNLMQRPNESPKNFLRRLNKMSQEMINEVEFEKQFGVEIKRNAETGEIIEIKNIKKKKLKSKKKTLSLKRKEKILAKKESFNNVKDFSDLRDHIEFGEVVHQPPNLITPKKLSSDNVNKKSRYSNLLLNNVIKEDKYKNKVSEVEKEKAETERKFIVEAYRKAKKVKKREKNF